ncbi:hypothetical protein FPV67DRAFT_1459468 [Lyophyllum atratum]|nr:hypothetical protein FPV67DRAFT_1459468 [Lyophyllum atratum]
MLTPRERGFLNDVGLRILDNTASITTSTLLYGTFVLLFFLSASKVFVNGPLDDTRLDDIDQSDFKIDQITVWTRQVLQIVGDMIVVWRAWALCIDHRWAILFPFALLFGTCASSFAFLALTSTLDGYNAYIFDGERVAAALYKAANSLSLATNVFSTLLIAYILWSQHKHWNIIMGGSWSRAQTILLMIIESGAIYGACQAMYPTIVLRLIDGNRSFTNLHGFSTTALGGLSQESGFKFSLHVPRSVHEVQGWIGYEEREMC